jgi:hypothetical protein
VDDAWGSAGTATLRFRLDQRAKIGERRRHRRRSRLVVAGDRSVGSARREQALDQRGRMAPRTTATLAAATDVPPRSMRVRLDCHTLPMPSRRKRLQLAVPDRPH